MTYLDAIYLLVPFAIKWLAPRSHLADAAVVLVLWLPIEFNWIHTWFIPLLGAGALVLIYQVIWPIKQPWKMGWDASPFSFDVAIRVAGVLAIVLLSIGFPIGFVRWNPASISLERIAFIVIFALVEEILFRGVMQNLLEKVLKNAKLALVLTSIVFGLAHLNNTSSMAVPPNWRYAILATIAGFGYGAVWLRTRSIAASTLTHSSINVLWKLGFN